MVLIIKEKNTKMIRLLGEYVIIFSSAEINQGKNFKKFVNFILTWVNNGSQQIF